MTQSPEISAAFNSAGIDPVAWTVAVRRMMLQLSKGNIRTAHRVLEDFVANEQVTNLDGPIDPEYCQWLGETDGQPVVCPKCRNEPEPVTEGPVIVKLPTVQPKEPVNMDADLDQVLRAIELLSTNKEKCLTAIDRKIDELEAELERYRSIRKTVEGKARRPKKQPGEPTAPSVRRRDWSDEVERIRQYVEQHGPSKPAIIAGSLGMTPIAVGFAIKTVQGLFEKDGYGRVILVA